MRVRITIVLILLAACGDDSLSGPSAVTVSDVVQADRDRLISHVEVLAADSLRGRGAGTADELKAALYISDVFAELGLEPVGPSGYLQTFEFNSSPDLPLGPNGGPGDLTRLSRSQNVVAALSGRGALSDQWVVLGAHYDHLGVGAHADSLAVFNGADDNASGTAVLLEVARISAAVSRSDHGRGHDRRSILFVAFGAEEKGLLGSLYFVEHPKVSLDRLVAMVNLDMVGRLNSGSLAVMGANSSGGWSDVIEEANDGGLDLWIDVRSSGRSDHYAFILAGVPAVHLFTGLHQDYHTPYDDVWFLDQRGLARVADFAAELLWDLALLPEPLR